MSFPKASVIIPTYNRAQSLRLSLEALSASTYPHDCYEVIVVDDGSESLDQLKCNLRTPFPIRFLEQTNQGATVARNNGAQASQAEILIFLDDDIDLVPQAISSLVETLQNYQRALALGQMYPVHPGKEISSANATPNMEQPVNATPQPVLFTECFTGILAIWRSDFIEIGGFQDPTGGWPNWDDVDFGYRAHLKGYNILRCPKAIGYHRDYALLNLKTSCLRVERAAKSAARLFQRYPELFDYLPMFHDKTPISLHTDPPALILHKLSHIITAWKPILSGLEGIAWLSEKIAPWPRLLTPIHRWIHSGYIYRGYRRGLEEIHQQSEER